MTLKELVEKLISRGMPEHIMTAHCGWKWDDEDWVYAHSNGAEVWLAAPVPRDLYEAWALRWFCATNDVPIGIWRGGVFLGDIEENEHKGIIEAIEAATRATKAGA